MKDSLLAVVLAGVLTFPAIGTVTAHQTLPEQPVSTSGQSSSNDLDNVSPNGGLPGFADLDKDHDGNLSRSEIPKDVTGLKPLRAHFMEADKDHNGRLSANEYARYIQNQVPESEKAPGQD